MPDISELSSIIPQSLCKQYEDAISLIMQSGRPMRVISHYDADGICAGSIMASALYRAGMHFHLSITHSLDAKYLSELKKQASEFVIFCDMGSGQLAMIEDTLLPSTVVIFDHHFPTKESSKVLQVNAHMAGIDGTSESCASTIAFMFAIGLSKANWDLYPLALAGAIGDKQHLGGLRGINAALLEAAQKRGIVKVSRELAIGTGPLAREIAESLEPYFAGIAGDENKAAQFLQGLGIDGSQPASALSAEKHRELVSVLALRLLSRGLRREIIEQLVAEQFRVSGWHGEVREISSYVNACGRTGNEEAGVAYCMNDAESQKAAEAIRTGYRAGVRTGLLALEQSGTQKMEHIQHFRAQNPSLAGAHAGIAMMYFLDQTMPVLALSPEGDSVKVSSRGTQHLVAQGLDLAGACRAAAESVGGHGGGHDIAAGATIPAEKAEKFLEKVDRIVGKQLEAGAQG